MFYIHFLKKKMSNSLIPSFLLSDVSKSLRSLTKNERPRAICSGRSEEMSNRELRSLTKNERMSEMLIFLSIFGQKTSDSLRKPMSEFPAL